MQTPCLRVMVDSLRPTVWAQPTAIERTWLMAIALEQAIRDKTAVVGVVGLGYVGLPLIRAFVAAGYRTMGFDVDQSKVDKLLAGQSYIGHIPSEWISQCIREGKFT